jgi:nitroreductase
MFLRGLGAAGLATGGAGIWRVMSNRVLSPASGPAYAPWNEWQQTGKGPLEELIRAAVLAANPHNSQPWKFRLQEDVVDVYADTSRQIGVIDPFFREMYIGIGCGLENLLLAAGHAGYQWSFDQAPPLADTVLQPAVRVRLTQASKRSSELYTAIPSRHTNRGSYVPARRLDASLIRALDDVGNSDLALRVFWFRSREEMQVFGKLVVSGTEAIIADAGQSRSSAQWMRTGWADIQRFRDGLTYDAQVLAPVKRAIAKFLPPLSPAQMDQYWLRETRDTQVATASMFGMIAVRDSQNLHDLIEAGRLWQRMQLFATLRGVAMQPLSQPIERRDRELQLGLLPTYANALGGLQQDSSWHAVMPFRLGYPKDEALPSPRRALSSVLL